MQKKRKMLLVLLLMIVPFLTIAFLVFTKNQSSPSGTASHSLGLNLQLPNALIKEDKSETKLSDYEKADLDSIKGVVTKNRDSELSLSFLRNDSSSKIGKLQTRSPSSLELSSLERDPNVERVYQKLEELKAQRMDTVKRREYSLHLGDGEKAKLAVKENSYKPLSSSKLEEEGDPDLEKLNGMMDKIIQIQHPEKSFPVQSKQQIDGGASFIVSEREQIPTIDLLGSDTLNNLSRAFYAEEVSNASTKEQNALAAIVYGTQSIGSGERVRFSTENAFVLNGAVVPKGSFIYGVTNFQGGRLEIQISSIRIEGSIYPVKLSVYDLDGMRGIAISGSVFRDVAKQFSEEAIKQSRVAPFDQSLTAQAAVTGIQAAKTLISKKVKQVKVTLQAGYQVFLKNEQ
ncbi:MAG: conjugative transposon protein TraM [Flavisolibacter sp.]